MKIKIVNMNVDRGKVRCIKGESIENLLLIVDKFKYVVGVKIIGRSLNLKKEIKLRN